MFFVLFLVCHISPGYTAGRNVDLQKCDASAGQVQGDHGIIGWVEFFLNQ